MKRLSTIRYLGVYLDENLSGDAQAADVLRKSSSRLSFLFRNSGLLDFKSRSTLCLSLIQPFLDYCCSSWYSGVNSKLKGRLDALQRKMARFVLGLEYRSTISPRHLFSLGWMSVSSRVQYFKLILAFKIRNGQAPSYLCDSFQSFSSVHSYNTRGSQSNYLVSKEDTASSLMMNSFTYTTKREWNGLPGILKKVTNLSNFKTKLRQYLMDRQQ